MYVYTGINYSFIMWDCTYSWWDAFVATQTLKHFNSLLQYHSVSWQQVAKSQE